jgi:hypothetical protein
MRMQQHLNEKNVSMVLTLFDKKHVHMAAIRDILHLNQHIS